MNFKYICNDCHTIYEIQPELMLCPKCREKNLQGKPLKGILKIKLPENYKDRYKHSKAFSIFDFLPVEKHYFPEIPVGNTPMTRLLNLEKKLNFKNLYVKNDSLNPTGSLKDRASYLVAAFAKKYNFNTISLASTGNAASSMAGVSAAAGLNTVIFMPASAPQAKLIQCIQYGAKVIPVKGNYDDAYDLSLEFSNYFKSLSRNTAYNPMTIEGKKTVSLEIYKDLNDNPDYVFVPVGDGVILDGVIKGFEDLIYTGIIDKYPKIIGVQSENSQFIYKAFKNNEFDLKYRANTLADSISVDVARNGIAAVKDLKMVNGDIIIVSDQEILEAQFLLSSSSGIFAEPAASAAFAGFLKIKDKIDKNAKIVILITGNGLKDLKNASKIVNIPKPVKPDLEVIKKLFL